MCRESKRTASESSHCAFSKPMCPPGGSGRTRRKTEAAWANHSHCWHLLVRGYAVTVSLVIRKDSGIWLTTVGCDSESPATSEIHSTPRMGCKAALALVALWYWSALHPPLLAYPELCRIFRNIPGLHLLDASRTSQLHPPDVTEMSLDMATCSLEGPCCNFICLSSVTGAGFMPSVHSMHTLEGIWSREGSRLSWRNLDSL